MSDPDFPQFPYRIASLQERLIDCFFIGTFFEIAAKSFLLDKGFVVHKLERSSNNLDIERMARRQSRTAVRVAELLQHDQFHDYKGNGRNGLESLRFETVDYGWLYGHGCFCSHKVDPLYA